MQQLETRDTYTPMDIPHVRSNCDQTLKDPRGKVGVSGLKTVSNNLDAALTVTGQTGQIPRVSVIYVLNKRKKPLMPCKPRKAKKLLKKGLAKVVKLTPFTIQLLYVSGEAKQDITLGVDSGYSHIGLSAISDKEELFSAEVHLREDIVKLNSERRMYRRSRRYRKTWYRKARFLNRGNQRRKFLPPSIQHKLDSHIKAIEEVKKFLNISKIIIEKQKYQEGDQLGFFNVREYVLHRDNHTCKHCKGRSKDPILNVHHITSRQTGGNRPDNLITLCKTCHTKLHKKEIKLQVKISKNFKPETFMTTIRRMLIDKLRNKKNVVSETYGYITKRNRINRKLIKSHIEDAFIISGGNLHSRQHFSYYIKQVRKCNRKLFKGIRSHIRNVAPRLIQNFQRFDKVHFKNKECFIFGRRKTGYFDLKDLEGLKIHSSAKAKDCLLLERFKTFLIQKRSGISSPI